MNRNFKAIGAAVLAAVMCASSAGCAKKEDTGVYVDKNGNISINESKLEDHVNSVFGGDTSNPTSSASEVSQPKEVKLEPTDEIKNAALNSGLVQYNNDIFQRGGYITVPDFVEKYKDRYDITYNCHNGILFEEKGSYDECKDYLLEYDQSYRKEKYYLALTKKNNSSSKSFVKAIVVNATSPDEKITLDKAIVVEMDVEHDLNHQNCYPEWFPLGFNGSLLTNYYDSENKNYTVNSLFEALKANGLAKNSEFEREGNLSDYANKADYNTYWKIDSNKVVCYIVGEENLFGAKPLYHYSFSIDPNTDKLSDVRCNFYFIKE